MLEMSISNVEICAGFNLLQQYAMENTTMTIMKSGEHFICKMCQGYCHLFYMKFLINFESILK